MDVLTICPHSNIKNSNWSAIVFLKFPASVVVTAQLQKGGGNKKTKKLGWFREKTVNFKWGGGIFSFIWQPEKNLDQFDILIFGFVLKK